MDSSDYRGLLQPVHMNSMPGSPEHVLRTLDGVLRTPCSVERMFRYEARLVTIQSINRVRPSVNMTDYGV